MTEIKSWLYDPASSIFKTSKNEKSKGFSIACEKSEECSLLKKGICIYKGACPCPYGKKHTYLGFSQRASKYYTWIADFRNEHKDTIDVNLNKPTKLCYFIDYVYLPLSYWNVKGEHSSVIEKSGGFLSHNEFIIKKDIFNAEFILNEIINYRPKTWFGNDDIKEYIDKEVPKFLRQLKSLDLELFNKVKELSDNKELFNLSDIGRTALLNTINPNCTVKINNELWFYDGEYLSSNKKSVFIIDGKYSEIRIKPTNDVKVIITEDGQVNENTEFIN